MAGTLYVVATPIGNLEDITLRATRVLAEADLIAAEDTRHTRKLLNHFSVKTRLTSYHEHNERAKSERILDDLKGGASVALVSDAGTPGISDPGYRLVRAAAGEGIKIVSVPGPSAVAAALSISGLPTDEFTFKGFVPSGAAQRKKFLASLKGAGTTVVVYETARRIEVTLTEIAAVLGEVEVAVAREMTKLHEEVVRGRVSEALAALKAGTIKGEITLVMSVPGEGADREGAMEELGRLLKGGDSVKDAAAAVSGAYGIARKDAYRMALDMKGEKGE